jgi:hypothetical protein
VIPEQQPVAKLAEATDGIDVMMEDVFKMARMTIGKELGPKLVPQTRNLPIQPKTESAHHLLK